MTTLTRHYVTFYSPGTFVAEETTKEIPAWDVAAAETAVADITERYGAHPYAFQFTTRERADEDFNSRETARSGMYYINCDVLTADEIAARNDPKDEILLSNMSANGWDRVIQTRQGWRWTQPLRAEDTVLS